MTDRRRQRLPASIGAAGSGAPEEFGRLRLTPLSKDHIMVDRGILMRKLIRRFFEKIEPGASNGADVEHDVRVATCALLLEMAHIDERFTDAEMEKILSVLRQRYGLDDARIDALVEEAEQERKQSIDYWKFARRINEHYTTGEKLEIIEMLWRVLFVDGKMDKYEHQLIHTLSNLLRLTQQQLIEAKLRVTTDAPQPE